MHRDRFTLLSSEKQKVCFPKCQVTIISCITWGCHYHASPWRWYYPIEYTQMSSNLPVRPLEFCVKIKTGTSDQRVLLMTDGELLTWLCFMTVGFLLTFLTHDFLPEWQNPEESSFLFSKCLGLYTFLIPFRATVMVYIVARICHYRSLDSDLVSISCDLQCHGLLSVK